MCQFPDFSWNHGVKFFSLFTDFQKKLNFEDLNLLTKHDVEQLMHYATAVRPCASSPLLRLSR